MQLVITEKKDKRNRTVIKVIKVGIHPEYHSITYTVLGQPDSIQTMPMTTQNNYFIRDI